MLIKIAHNWINKSAWKNKHLIKLGINPKTTARLDENHFSFGIWCVLYYIFYGILHGICCAVCHWVIFFTSRHGDDKLNWYSSISFNIPPKWKIHYNGGLTTPHWVFLIQSKQYYIYIYTYIYHSSKSLLFSENSSWIKRQSGQFQFDLTTGSFDGAEICELVGLYILNLLCTRFSKYQVGLYRDDGLAALKLSGPQADRERKDIERTLKECGLRVTVEILLKQADFLDVTLDLPTGKFWPYRKPNNDPLYINAKSKHHQPSWSTCLLLSAVDSHRYRAMLRSSTGQNPSTRRPTGKAVSTGIWSTLISRVTRERYTSVTSPGVVYKASISAPNKPTRHYYELTEGPFKTRYNSHTRSFRSENCRRETEL